MASVYETFRDSIRAEEPVALATVIDGIGVGAKLLVRPDGDPVGSLGNADLDRVVTRDALGMLDSGTSEVRHYGPAGEARQHEVSVFVESSDDQIEVFVTDQGAGFDTGTVPIDRHGIESSIIGRMQRAGGGAELTSASGEGTEVRLWVKP